MDFKTYQKHMFRTANHTLDKKEMLVNACLGLAGEAGEFNDAIKKVIYHGHNPDTEKLTFELGDILWYISLACYALDLELDEVAIKNIDKLTKRYPKGFTSKDSINRE